MKPVHLIYAASDAASYARTSDALIEVNRQIAAGKQGTWIIAEEVTRITVQTAAAK